MLSASAHSDFSVYFFDVGQGDAEMLALPSGASFLVDGGRGSRVLEPLDKIFKWKDRYIDLVFLSHPQQDHLEGLLKVAERYRIGAFLVSSDQSEHRTFRALIGEISRRKIPVVILKKGDAVRQGDARIEILSPPRSPEIGDDVNDSSLVLYASAEGASVLFTGDIGKEAELELLKSAKGIRADVLKVPHHGSKYSSSAQFLASVRPAVSVIEVGKNSYGHPTQEAMQRLRRSGTKILRTDIDGNIKITVRDGIVEVFTRVLR